ncbi:LIM/homeobox protein Lhx3, partial [Araneus ventricosus]
MDMENLVYKMQSMIHEKGGHIQGSSHILAEEVILLNKGL